ncbi:NTP transferase domain-containing protein [Candidatus Peregrinibacteria bacterium]|nr:NTP transferase domain-containing protein [Candidatus Peregrinibacteria bacterium]
MKIVLLAGGKSERIKPFYEKPLLKFCGKTLIRHQLEILFEAGGRDFLIIGSPSNVETIKTEATLFTEQIGGLVDVGVQQIDDGSAGALKSIKLEKYFTASGKDEGVLIVSSNDVLELTAYTGLLNTAEQNPGCSVIVGQKVSNYFPGGYLMINAKNELQKIVEKPGPGNEPSDLINIVAHFHPSAEILLKFVSEARSETDDIYETALDNMIKAGKTIKVAHYSGKWQAIKFPWHIYEAAKMLFEKELRWRGKQAGLTAGTAIIAADLVKAESAVIRGDVIIEEGVKIFDHSTVVGPVYLGKGAVVANNALVRESFLGDGCVAGYNTEIARSYLGEQVWTHSYYLGDSVIGNNVSFGAGAVTGNLRLDEKDVAVTIKGVKVNTGHQKIGLFCGNDVRIGVNTSLMPGIKIGQNSMIGAGLTIGEDIEENSYVTGSKGGLVIKENLAKIRNDRTQMMDKLNQSANAK